MHNDEKQFMIKKGEHVNNIPADDIFNIVRKNNLLAMNERT
jgi:hypothetical protein